MALIKTIAEIRAVIPRLSNLSNTASLPNVDKAGRLHILPILGKELYKGLNDKYNANPVALSEDENELLKNIQLPLAAFALLDDLAFIHTVITDSGIRTTHTDKMDAAHRWEFKELEKALISCATDGIELLLQYLFDSKDKWPMWTSSDEYKELNGFLIKSGTDFRRYYPLHQPLRTFWSLRPIMQGVEENYFASRLGRDLLAWAKSQNEIVITVDGQEVNVKMLIKRAMAHLTIKHAPEQLAVRFDDNGFTVLAMGGDIDSPTSDSRQAAGYNDMKVKTVAADREGQNNLSRAARYLVGIAAGDYNGDFGNDFLTAFERSPLKPDREKPAYTNGNERRKIYRMP